MLHHIKKRRFEMHNIVIQCLKTDLKGKDTEKLMKTIKVALCVLIGLALLLPIYYLFGVVFPPIPSMKISEYILKKCYSPMTDVVVSFQQQNGSIIYISEYDDYHYVTICDTMPVQKILHNDEQLYSALVALFTKYNCEIISMDKNYIFFSWWGSLDAICGIVYSLDGERPRIDDEIPAERREEKYIPIMYENWYYFYVKILHKSAD